MQSSERQMDLLTGLPSSQGAGPTPKPTRPPRRRRSRTHTFAILWKYPTGDTDRSTFRSPFPAPRAALEHLLTRIALCPGFHSFTMDPVLPYASYHLSPDGNAGSVAAAIIP